MDQFLRQYIRLPSCADVLFALTFWVCASVAFTNKTKQNRILIVWKNAEEPTRTRHERKNTRVRAHRTHTHQQKQNSSGT